MTQYLIRRLVATSVLLLLVATIVFFMIHLLPGDPARIILGENASAEAVARLRTQLGFDKPVLLQYVNYLARLGRGDFGSSLMTGRSVGPELGVRLGRTAELVFVANLLAGLVGIGMGIAAAAFRNTQIDRGLSMLALVGFSAPAFVRGTLLILLFSLMLGWFPSGGYVAPSVNMGDHLRRLVLPVLTLSLSSVAVTMRMTRTSILDVLGEDFIRTARAKGLSPATVMFKHTMRNALVPVVAVVGLQVGSALSGAVVTETIFTWPGLTSMLLLAAQRRDYPTIQAALLIIAVAYVMINLVTDIIYGLLDPRIRYD